MASTRPARTGGPPRDPPELLIRPSTRWMALQIARRPCAVVCAVFGACLLVSLLFAAAWLSGRLELKIDTSPESFVIREDEVADRQASWDAAREHSSTVGPASRAVRASRAEPPPPPSDGFVQYPILTIYYSAEEHAEILTPAAVRRMRALERRIAARLEAHGLCRQQADAPHAPCEGFYSVASLLHAPEREVPRYVDFDLSADELQSLRPLLSSFGIDAASLEDVAPSMASAKEALSLLSAGGGLPLRLALANHSQLASLLPLIGPLGDGAAPLLLDALRHARCATLTHSPRGVHALRCGPLLHCCATCDRWDVALASATRCPTLSLPLCSAPPNGTRLSFRDLRAPPAPPDGAALAAGVRRVASGCGGGALGPVSFCFPLSYGAAGGVTRRVRAFVPAGTYERRFAAAAARGEARAGSYEEFVKQRDYEEFIQQEVMPMVLSFNEEEAAAGSEPRMAAAAYDYRGRAIVTWEIYTGLTNAAWLSLLGVCLMCCFMALHLHSLLLTIAGLAGVVLSFPVTWAIYTVVLGIRYMGMLNFIALFVIVGIGVDDVFIFIDAWRQAADSTHDLESRVLLAYSRSLHAMTITSITDSAAFFSNVLSLVPVCRVFGVFMGLLILVDFAICLTYFPAVVVLHHRWSSASPRRRCLGWLCAPRDQPLLTASTARTSTTELQHMPSEHVEAPAAAPATAALRSDAPCGAAPRRPWTATVELLFSTHFLPALHRRRAAVLVVCLAVCTVSAISLTQMQLSKEDFRATTFPKDSNMGRLLDSLGEYSLEINTSSAHIAWGVDGIDRSHSDPNDPQARGTPVWAAPWAPGAPAAQEAVLRTCERAARLDFVVEQRCFIEPFARWVRALRGAAAFPVAEAEFEPLLSRFVFYSARVGLQDGRGCAELTEGARRTGVASGAQLVAECEAYRATERRAGEDWSDLVRWEVEGAAVPRLRMLAVVLNVTMAWGLSASESVRYFDELEALVAAANRDAPAGFRAVQSHEKWRPMRTEQVMVPTAVRGCFAALGLALLALTCLLRNWRTALLAALSISAVVLMTVASQVWLGWSFSFIESMCVTVVAGFSVDFIAHIAIAYTEASTSHLSRYNRCDAALRQLGVSILSGASSTALATMTLLCCTMVPFAKFGTFMLINVLFSLAVALGPFICTLLICGPEGDSGRLHCLPRKKDGESSPSSEPSS
ncbi:hypothetical protein AB1Y20_022197 [Prymnesium parvum]|uniref:SSD domain-containing protein n=1 Tax=Prymnesium parvum TaxID=97485 RepID=A0AB34JGI0_PRYPA